MVKLPTQHESEILGLLARGEREIEEGKGFDLDAVLAEAAQEERAKRGDD
jgi:hypothetical protein